MVCCSIAGDQHEYVQVYICFVLTLDSKLLESPQFRSPIVCKLVDYGWDSYTCFFHSEHISYCRPHIFIYIYIHIFHGYLASKSSMKSSSSLHHARGILSLKSTYTFILYIYSTSYIYIYPPHRPACIHTYHTPNIKPTFYMDAPSAIRITNPQMKPRGKASNRTTRMNIYVGNGMDLSSSGAHKTQMETLYIYILVIYVHNCVCLGGRGSSIMMVEYRVQWSLKCVCVCVFAA